MPYTNMELLNCLPDSVLILSKDGRIEYVNTQFCSIFRMQSLDVKYKTIFELGLIEGPINWSSIISVGLNSSFEATFDIDGQELLFKVSIKEFDNKYLMQLCQSRIREVDLLLIENDIQHKFILDSLKDAIYVVDPQLNIIFTNKSMIEFLTGLDIPTTIIGQNVFEAFPFLNDIVRQEFERVIEEHDVVIAEKYHILNGQELWIQTRKVPVIRNGKVSHIIVFITDITEVKKAYFALKEEEERYRTVVEASPQAVCVVQNNIIKFINENGASLLGFADATLAVGKKFDKFVSEIDLPRLNVFLTNELVSSTPRNIRVKMYRTNKESFFAELVISSLIVDGISASLIMIFDITQTIRVKQALESSEQKYRAIIENTEEGIVVIKDSKLVFCNTKFANIYGASISEILGLHFKNIIHPSDYTTVFERYQKRIAGEYIEPHYSFRIITKNGEIRWLDMHVTKITWDNSQATLALLLDQTKTIESEQKITYTKKFLLNLIDVVPNRLWVKDQSNKYVLVNRALANDLASRPEELIGQNVYKVLTELGMSHEEVASMVEEDRIALTKLTHNYTKQFTFPCSQKVFYCTKVPIDLEDGTTGVLGVGEDLTEVLRLQMEYFNLNKLHERIVEMLPHGLIIADNNKTIKWVNKYFIDKYGVSDTSEVIGKNLEDFYYNYEETKPDIINFYQQLQQVGYGQFEAISKLKDGSPLWVQISGCLLNPNDPNDGRILAAITIIDNMKKVEQSLYKSNSILQAVNKIAYRAMLYNLEPDDLQRMLAYFGQLLDVDRAYIFKTIIKEDQFAYQQAYEWCKEGIEPQLDNSNLQCVSCSSTEAINVARWFNIFENKEAIVGDIATFPEVERNILEAQGIKTLICVPLLTHNKHHWGFIGFDNCSSPYRQWSELEVNAIQSLATLASLIISKIESDYVFNQVADNIESKLKVVQESMYTLTNSMQAKLNGGQDSE